MWARWTTFLLWALALGTAVFWGLRLSAQGTPVPAQATVAQPGAGFRGDLSRVLGVDTPAPAPAAAEAPAPVAADARFQLVGVVAPRAGGREGVALIAVDGRPARAYRVGNVVVDGQVLQSVSLRGAMLGPRGGPAQVALNIPPPPEPARGTLGDPGSPAPGPDGTAMPSPSAAAPAGMAGFPPPATGFPGGAGPSPAPYVPPPPGGMVPPSFPGAVPVPGAAAPLVQPAAVLPAGPRGLQGVVGGSADPVPRAGHPPAAR